MKKTTIFTLCLIFGLTGVSSAQEKSAATFHLDGKRLTKPTPVEEAFSGDSEPWREDFRKVSEATNIPMTPEEYRQALENTGLNAHLATAGLRTPGDRTDWIQRGPIGAFGDAPKNGRISGIQIIHPADSTPTVYAGSCQGGLWMSQDSDQNGGIWQDIGRTLPNPSVRAFAVDPENSQHIIVGTGDHSRYNGSGIYVTFDGGDSWAPRATPGNPGYYYRLFYQNRPGSPAYQYVIAASSMGVFLSSDRGSTWNSAIYIDGSPVDGLWTDLVEDPVQPHIMYACVMNPVNPDASGVYKSYDYGQIWAQLPGVNLPAGEDWGRASMAICRTAPDNLAIIVESDRTMSGIFKTTDGGGTWANITGLMSGFGGDQLAHAQAIAIHPDHPEFIYIGGVSLAWSPDGGTNWLTGAYNTINAGHADITQLYFSDIIPGDNLWICNDGGIYYHNFTTSFTYSYIGGPQTGLACSEVDYLDANRDIRVIGLQDNAVLFSDNAGQTWIPQATGDGADVEIYDPVGGHYWYLDGFWPPPRVWKAWKKRSDEQLPAFMNNPLDVSYPSLSQFTDTGEMVSHNQQAVYITLAETGGNWTQVATDLQTDPYVIRSVKTSQSGDHAYFVLYGFGNWGDLTIIHEVEGQGQVKHHIEDVAGTGQMISSVTPSREWPGECWVTFRGASGTTKVMHTTDYGSTWTDLTNELNWVAVVETLEVQPFNPLVLYAGTNLGMFRSIDGGQSWETFHDGLPIGRCKEIRIALDPWGTEHTLELAMDGRGVWTMPVPSPRIIYVDGDSTAAESGTREHPYHTVSTALQNAPAGAILAVRSNSYNEPYVYNGDVVVMTWSGTTEIR